MEIAAIESGSLSEVYRLSNCQRVHAAGIPSLHEPDGRLIVEATAVMERLRVHLSEVWRDAGTEQGELGITRPADLRAEMASLASDLHVEMADIGEAIDELASGAVGLDRIPVSVFHRLRDVLVEPLSLIYERPSTTATILMHGRRVWWS